jgi:hypothetical protein
MALGIVPDDPDSATKAFADLKIELDQEKATWKAAQIEVDMLARAVKDLKISADKFATQIHTLEGGGWAKWSQGLGILLRAHHSGKQRL